ncbi:MAG: glycosyltransferase family 2 protein [Candidatus Eremiobacteraeota bacterium]|nr:glycosyltransferase family 2 protein [Candidatus Eremiobacteraeota bacterium]
MTDHVNNNRRPLSVVMPVYNEERTLNAIVAKVLRIVYLRELVIVDDCSTDGTRQLATALAAQDTRIRYFRLERNMGKTNALKAGFAMTVGDIVIVQDADLEYDPTEISEVIQPIVDGHADVVYGSRFLVRKAARVLNFHHFLGNKFLTFLSDAFTNLNLTDVETCYKAFRGEIIRNMILTSSGFGFEIEVTAKVAKLGCRVYETPISYYGRTYAEGKKIGARDGFAALWYIMRYNLFTSLRSSYRTMPRLSSSNGGI